MRAMVVNEWGGPAVIRPAEVEMPRVGPGQALVRVKACGVCFLDTIVRSGLRSKAKRPLVLGHEIAGEVAEVGPGVGTVKVGDRVAVAHRVVCGHCFYCRGERESLCDNTQGVGVDLDGGYAEYAVIPELNLQRVPEGVGYEQAAVCGCVVGACYVGLVKKAGVRPGETVLVTGAGGGIGIHSVQIAKMCGARVLATTTSAGKVDRIREWGADEVICTPGDFSDQVRRLTGGRGADVVLESVGSPVFAASFRALAKGGRFVFAGELTGAPASFNAALVIYKEPVITGVQPPTGGELGEVLHLVATGRVKPVVSQVLPLAEAARVHKMLAEKSHFGRVVLTA
jgi:D-arabinose 1-dehydrogenase-like Zn-dependent alcohol dehydrogenase